MSTPHARSQLCCVGRIRTSGSRRGRRVRWSISTSNFPGSLIIVLTEPGFYDDSSKLTFSGYWMSPLQLSHSSERVNQVVSLPLEVDRLGNQRFL
jgi:hypothetical protein